MSEDAQRVEPKGRPRKMGEASHLAMLAELGALVGGREKVPQVFEQRRPKVLKIGVHEDLFARFPDADKDKLKRWLRRWVATFAYQTAVMYRNHRHDLDGNDVASINDHSRSYATKRATAMDERYKRRSEARKVVALIGVGTEVDGVFPPNPPIVIGAAP